MRLQKRKSEKALKTLKKAVSIFLSGYVRFIIRHADLNFTFASQHSESALFHFYTPFRIHNNVPHHPAAPATHTLFRTIRFHPVLTIQKPIHNHSLHTNPAVTTNLAKISSSDNLKYLSLDLGLYQMTMLLVCLVSAGYILGYLKTKRQRHNVSSRFSEVFRDFRSAKTHREPCSRVLNSFLDLVYSTDRLPLFIFLALICLNSEKRAATTTTNLLEMAENDAGIGWENLWN